MATLKDIAAKAGVDVSIVSRILHKRDYGRASKETRQRIERVARELGYVPNVLARSLVRQKTDMVGLMIPDLYDPAFVRYLETVDELLVRSGIQVIPMLSRWSKERENRLLNMARQRLVDGVISFYFEGSSDLQAYLELRESGVPVVFRVTEDLLSGKPFDQVNINIAEGGYALTQHMLAQGYSRIALLGGIETVAMAESRPCGGIASGYARAYRESGREIDPVLAIPCEDNGSDSASRLVKKWEENPGLFDAVLVQSNSKLPGVYRALAKLGLKIGTEIGVATITDSEICHLTDVPISVWEQPVQRISEELVRLLLLRMRNSDALIEKVDLHSRLIVRASTLRKSQR